LNARHGAGHSSLMQMSGRKRATLFANQAYSALRRFPSEVGISAVADYRRLGAAV